MSLTRLRLAFAAMAVLVCLPPVAFGYPMYSRLYRVKYRDQGGCNICHNEGGGTKRNAYGEEWQRSGEDLDAFARIDRHDSDGDGASNAQEIAAGSNPGDRSSTLVRPGYKWHLRHQVPVPMEQIRHAVGVANDYGFREVDLSEAQSKRLETIADRALRFEERHPTLYFALEGTKRRATAIFVYPQLESGRSALLLGLLPDGKIRKLFLLRAGKDDVRIYRSFLDCLEKSSDSPSSPEQPACVPPKGYEAAAREILKALQLGRATVAVVLS